MNVFFVVAVFLTLFYLGAVVLLYRGLCRLSIAYGENNLTFSVVIAARNEAASIRSCLDSIFCQTIAPERFEVIVVNDRSSDATGEILNEYSSNHPSLRIISIKETPPGVAPKKYAVMQGVAAAKNKIIVTTDADCNVTETWLAALDRNFSPQISLVQGITTYHEAPGLHPLFFGLQAIDFLSHGIVAAAAIGADLPINSNANNFAYRKEAFSNVNGFGSAGSVVSGDDDLLLQRIAGSKAWRVRFMIDPKGAVTTEPTKTIRGVFEQRKRWGSKTVHYNTRQVFFLGGIFLFYAAMLSALVSGAFYPKLFIVFVAMFSVKVIGEYLLMIKGTALFHKKELRRYILPASLIQLPVVVTAVLFGIFGRFTWKGQDFGRRVKG